MDTHISFMQAALLGIVEGITEFLPISSTGHLILCGRLLEFDLRDPGVDAFMVVIQSGALLAVLGRYHRSVRRMALGAIGRDAAGLTLAGQLLAAFVPAVICGLLLGDLIKEHLFKPLPVAGALAIGGALMLGLQRMSPPARTDQSPNETNAALNVGWKRAILIGCAQCLALWPGTSRSMATIVAGVLLGLSLRESAEFSFLLALPTLGAATLHDLAKHGPEILHSAGAGSLAIGFILSAVFAALAVHSFIRYLNRHGMAAFGYYRIGLAAIVYFFWSS